MNIISVVGIAIVCATLVILLRKNSPEFALPVSVAASAIILLIAVSWGSDIFLSVTEIAATADIDSDNIKILFKALGICYITQIGKDACADCGETALADKVDLAGKISIAAISLPMILQVLELITDLIEK